MIDTLWCRCTSTHRSHVQCWWLTLCDAGVHRHTDHIHSDMIHVVTTTPVCLYSMDTRKQHLSCVDLYDVFPGSTSRYQSYRPRLRLAPLGFPLDANIIIHDELVSITVCYCLIHWTHLQTSLCRFVDNQRASHNQSIFKVMCHYGKVCYLLWCDGTRVQITLTW